MGRIAYEKRKRFFCFFTPVYRNKGVEKKCTRRYIATKGCLGKKSTLFIFSPKNYFVGFFFMFLTPISENVPIGRMAYEKKKRFSFDFSRQYMAKRGVEKKCTRRYIATKGCLGKKSILFIFSPKHYFVGFFCMFLTPISKNVPIYLKYG